MTNDTVQQIEENIRQAKEIVEFEKTLLRLMENKDFRKVIGDGYLRDEAVRLVHLRGDPAMQTPERQASVLRQIDSISHLSNWFRTVAHNASVARKAIEADEETREELLREEAGQ